MIRSASIASAICLSVLFSHSSVLKAEDIDFTGFVDGQAVNTLSTSSTDVTFSFTDANSILTAGQPVISSGSGLTDSLAFRMNSSNTSDFVSLLVTFDDTDVSGVGFTFGDIDFTDGAWQDIVVVTGLLNGTEVGTISTSNFGSTVGRDTNGNIYLTDNNATLFGSANNDERSGESNGNVDVAFFGVIDSFRVDYRPGHGSDYLPGYGPKDPTSQFIRMGNLSFSSIPEPGSLILFGSVIFGSAVVRRRRR